jgi:hypothetical protein
MNKSNLQVNTKCSPLRTQSTFSIISFTKHKLDNRCPSHLSHVTNDSLNVANDISLKGKLITKSCIMMCRTGKQNCLKNFNF